MSKKNYFRFIKKETKAHREDFFRITLHMNPEPVLWLKGRLTAIGRKP